MILAHPRCGARQILQASIRVKAKPGIRLVASQTSVERQHDLTLSIWRQRRDYD
jgi:hypothetical protein